MTSNQIVSLCEYVTSKLRLRRLRKENCQAKGLRRAFQAEETARAKARR